MITQKIMAVLLVLLTVPIIFMEKDATATGFALIFSVPMFVSRESWFY